MRRKINGEAYLIIKKNYTLIIRNSNSDSKITLLIGLTTISLNKLSFFSYQDRKNRIVIRDQMSLHKGYYRLKKLAKQVSVRIFSLQRQPSK